MIDLLLDSSNVDLSVGIAKDNKVIDYISYEAWQCQSEYMIQEIDKLLTKHNISRNDLGSVICNIGPGSYTGIRISLTIAKVTCLALNIPLYALSSLRALQKEHEPTEAPGSENPSGIRPHQYGPRLFSVRSPQPVSYVPPLSAGVFLRDIRDIPGGVCNPAASFRSRVSSRASNCTGTQPAFRPHQR